jgi:hypothetical protein
VVWLHYLDEAFLRSNYCYSIWAYYGQTRLIQNIESFPRCRESLGNSTWLYRTYSLFLSFSLSLYQDWWFEQLLFTVRRCVTIRSSCCLISEALPHAFLWCNKYMCSTLSPLPYSFLLLFSLIRSPLIYGFLQFNLLCQFVFLFLTIYLPSLFSLRISVSSVLFIWISFMSIRLLLYLFISIPVCLSVSV